MCCLFLQERNCVFFLLFLLQHVLNLYVKIIIIKKGGIGRMCLLFIIVRGERERKRNKSYQFCCFFKLWATKKRVTNKNHWLISERHEDKK